MRTDRIAQSFRRVLLIIPRILAVGLVAGLVYNDAAFPVNAIVDTAQAKTEEGQVLEYHVWRIIPPGKKGKYALAIVSVNPKLFNREDMTQLAMQLNREFAREAKVNVALFDDERTPRYILSGGAEIPTFYAEQRGLYSIDRTKCKEYVQFSPQRAKPRVSITFKCERQKR